MKTRSVISPNTTLGARMANTIAARDAGELGSLFATPVVFRAVTPRRFWDAETPLGVVDIVLGVWFDPSKTVTRIVVLDSGIVGDVERVSYQMDVDVAGQPAVIEQVAYYSQEQGQITQMRLVCSGFRPV